MAINDNKTALKSVRQRNYLARDFDGFRAALLDYARQYYPDRIQDFSEASLGGLFIDMAAYIGDNMSFYLDHLYGELNSDTVVETKNIERLLRNNSVPIVGASSATAIVDFYIEVPVLSDGTLNPDPTLIPTIKEGSTIQSDSGIKFDLLEDIKFWKSNPKTGVITVDIDVEVVNGKQVGSSIITKILRKAGVCGSGAEASETFSIGEFVQFRRLNLSQSDITQLISVSDNFGNVYYEVDSLASDVVYKNVLNMSDNNLLVPSRVRDNLKIIPAPYRFLREVSLSDRKTTLTFGGGTADNLEDDIIPDPSEFSIPLPYSQAFSRLPLNPQKLLQTSTLGIAASNTTLTVKYRYGGGLSHNALPGTIRNITNLIMFFPDNPSAIQQSRIKNSAQALNPQTAAGGEDTPSANELLALAPSMKSAQDRIVTKEDLISRVYTMPSNFGRVFRAAVVKNPNNPMAARMFIISRDQNNQLLVSPDRLKINLKRYLNAYRMISDAIDIMDAQVINLELVFQILADPNYHRSTLLSTIISALKEQLQTTRFHIGQPIVISDVISTIYSIKGVISVDKIKFNNLRGTMKNMSYSPVSFNPQMNTKNQILYPPDGGIFEIKYPDINIVGKCASNK